jgi:hypothetical protein
VVIRRTLSVGRNSLKALLVFYPSTENNILSITLCSLLGAVEKLRKATISFVVSVCESAWGMSAPTGRIFMTFDIRVVVKSLSRKFKCH